MAFQDTAATKSTVMIVGYKIYQGHVIFRTLEERMVNVEQDLKDYQELLEVFVQALRRSAVHGLPSAQRRGYPPRADLQHLRPSHGAQGRPCGSRVSGSGVAR